MDVLRGIDLLEQSGGPGALLVGALTADSAELTTATRRTRTRVRGLDVPPSPARVDQDLQTTFRTGRHDALLYVVPRLTASLRRRAQEDHRLVVAAVDQGIVIHDGAEWQQDRPDTPPRAPRGRKPWGRLALLRVLLRTAAPRTQAQLAAEVGTSQQAVALALHALRPLGVERSRGGWAATDPGVLWDSFLNDYPGPGGIRRRWEGVSSLDVQADRALDVARSAGVTALASGDTAADRQAPLRRPVTATVYATTDLDLSARFAPAAPGSDTLSVVVPADPTVFATARAWAGVDVRCTDPLITAWELSRSRGADRDEAAEFLRETTIGHRRIA